MLLEIQSEARGRWPRRCGCPWAHCPACRSETVSQQEAPRSALGAGRHRPLGTRWKARNQQGKWGRNRQRRRSRTEAKAGAENLATRGCSRACERAAQEPGACLSAATVPRQVRRLEPQARLSSHKAATGGTPRMESSGVRPPCSQGLQHRLPRGVLQRWPAVAALNRAPESAGGGRVSGAQSTAGWR